MRTNKVFFTSDTHFFHQNIIGYCNRPFLSADEMDACLIENWNKVVSRNDVIYHLGDFAITGYSRKYIPKVEKLLSKLNGNKILIRGNHDSQAVLKAKGWASIHDLHHVNIDGQHIILCHYAMRTWQFKNQDSWMLYGHNHNTLPPIPGDLSMDVGVDCFQYTPIEFARIKDIMDKVILDRENNKENNKEDENV